jgi:hypothetical protein
MNHQRGPWAIQHLRKKSERYAYAKRGKAHIEQVQSCYHVFVPYHPDWPIKARELGADWRYRSQIWTFPGRVSLRQILNLLIRVFGESILDDGWRLRRESLNAKATIEEKMRDGI